MGHRLHIPRAGAKVGTITVEDRRARWARIFLNNVDVTRPTAERMCVAASDVEGWVAWLDRRTRLVTQERGDVYITFEAPEQAYRT